MQGFPTCPEIHAIFVFPSPLSSTATVTAGPHQHQRLPSAAASQHHTIKSICMYLFRGKPRKTFIILCSGRQLQGQQWRWEGGAAAAAPRRRRQGRRRQQEGSCGSKEKAAVAPRQPFNVSGGGGGGSGATVKTAREAVAMRRQRRPR